jgi:hypothetical protein
LGLSTPLNEKATVESRGKYYKLETPDEPIIDQTALEAINDLLPSVGEFALKDKWKAPIITKLAEEPVVRVPVIIQKAVVQHETSVRILETKPAVLAKEEKREVQVPSIALQVAIYHRESQALKAQKRIMSKLNLPVEIVKQFEYYHVIVTGFYSREETFQYYPELAGIGYPRITLLENYKRQK